MLKYGEITEKIIKAAYTVHNQLGPGFAEKVYHNALGIEILGLCLDVEHEKRLTVSYKGTPVGEFYADLCVNKKIIVEIKATDEHLPRYEAQLLNYLKATGMEVGLLINFGSSVKVKRMVF